ncbi:MAG TPA: 5-oxoprolinase, partial [Candidatus Latescibacteria bacterium]|nr:5-oxoprolinase [Candidatus Latescibacterota bacterium]
MNPDPITLELMRNRWTGIAEEMCAALIRTSYSTNIKDRRDCSAAIAQTSGEILAQAESGVPLHLGNMPGVISSILDVFPVETMQPGEMYITNLPYPDGPGHLPDVSLVSVIYHEDRPVALAASTAHHVDMGGFAPGSMPFGVTEIYQEGLQIPPLRMFVNGQIDEQLYKLINQNVRTQYEVRGDLMAQFACGQIGQQRVSELLNREDPAETIRYMDEIQAYAERRMRAGITLLPDGQYTFEDYLDDDGVIDEPVKIKVTITISGDTFRADFTGSSRQVLG